MSFRIPQLLSDEPAIVDSFGAHKRIASTLATLIKTSEGGKSIRLDGAWGAGKSTVIEILRMHLKESQGSDDGKSASPLVFLYDAWVHSGDGLRRAFLEELVKDLNAHGWVAARSAAEKRWQQKLAGMAGKRKVVTKTTKPELTWRARVLIALGVTGAMVAPAIYKLLSLALEDWSVTQLSWLTAFAAVGLCALLYALGAADLRVLLTRSTLEEMTETVADPEPTSIEFQEAFDELMSEFLTTERKLVVVIDNLDRIEFDEAKQVWTLLRSFLDNPTFRKKQWFKRLWLLVPIADEGRLLGLTGQTVNGSVVATQQGNILEKVFQVRMSLPLPMLRLWKEFLAEKLHFSFGADDDGSQEIVARLLHASATHSAPTPREIVVFVNELVALHIERQGDMPLSTLAAYILSRREPRAKEWQVPQGIAQVYFTPTIEQDFATLYLHAERSVQSLYLLITPSLERALDKGDPIELRDVLDSSPAALDVLEQWLIVTFSRLSQSSENANAEQDHFLAYLRALVLFTGPELSGQSHARFLSHIRPRIDRIMQLTTSLKLANPNVAEGVAAYLELTGSEENAIARVTHLLHTLERFTETVDSASPGAWDVWARSLIEILSVEKVRAAIAQPGVQRIRLPVPTERWVIFCSTVVAEPGYRFVLDILDISEADGWLADWIVTQMIPMGADNSAEIVLQQAFRSRGKEFFQRVAQKTVEAFQARSDLPPFDIMGCLICLITVSNEEAKPFVKRLAEGGMFYLWARTPQVTHSFTLDETLIRFAIVYLWGEGQLPPKYPNTDASAFSTIIQNFFQGNASSAGNLINACNDLILRTRIYDVLTVIENVSAGKYEVLSKMLLGLCSYADFVATAQLEMSGDMNSTVPKLLIGQRAEVMRELLVRAMANAQSQSSDEASSTR